MAAAEQHDRDEADRRVEANFHRFAPTPNRLTARDVAQLMELLSHQDCDPDR